ECEDLSPGVAETDADANRLARFGYRQELSRVLTLFENFSVAFCYLSPVLGIYSSWERGLRVLVTYGSCPSSCSVSSWWLWCLPSLGATTRLRVRSSNGGRTSSDLASAGGWDGSMDGR